MVDMRCLVVIRFVITLSLSESGLCSYQIKHLSAKEPFWLTPFPLERVPEIKADTDSCDPAACKCLFCRRKHFVKGFKCDIKVYSISM